MGEGVTTFRRRYDPAELCITAEILKSLCLHRICREAPPSISMAAVSMVTQLRAVHYENYAWCKNWDYPSLEAFPALSNVPITCRISKSLPLDNLPARLASFSCARRQLLTALFHLELH